MTPQPGKYRTRSHVIYFWVFEKSDTPLSEIKRECIQTSPKSGGHWTARQTNGLLYISQRIAKPKKFKQQWSNYEI